jgi:methionine--tRNA ligase beta chain
MLKLPSPFGGRVGEGGFYLLAIAFNYGIFAPMNNPKRYLITSALPYANGPKHIGHLAGAYLPADIYTRYLRAQKRDVVFVCGSDEHGAAITIQAMKENTTPKAIVDKYHALLESNMKDLGISFDIYHRTSSPIHHETAQEFFTKLNNNGDLIIKESEQYFDDSANTFLADRYIIGTCPICSSEGAYGDQCEKCGTSLSPEQLINPKSTLSGNPPSKKKTTHWYLPLDKHEDFLREWILENHKSDWKTNVLGQCKSWIDAGLQPRAVTRDLEWGVKVPAPLPPKGGIDDLQKEYNSSSDLNSENVDLLEEGQFLYQTSDPMLYGLLKDFAVKNRSNPTQAEIALWEMLRGKNLDGYKFRRQHIIGDYIADFVCLKKKLIIEVDGLIHQLPENKINDEERTQWLSTRGFEVIRFTNEQVLFDTDNTLQAISNKLSSITIETNVTQNVNSTTTDFKLNDNPNPPLGGGGAGKVLYVWFDAPIGYISATKQWAINNNKDWKPYWEDKDTKLVHFIGKDNIVFHCIIFPVMLKLHGNILPDNVPSNEFMNLEGDKMSTSRGWSIEMDDYINDFVKIENGGGMMVDALRYYLTAIAPETKDSEFTWKGFQDALNSELVSIFGNFVNRTFVLMHKLCNGKVPPLHQEIIDEADRKLLADISNAKQVVEANIENYKYRDALFEVIDLARKGNKYMQDKEPWIVAKQVGVDGKPTEAAQKQIDNCLHFCLQLSANLAILINPFLPSTAEKLCYMMKVVNKMLDWENAGKSNLLSVGYSLRAPELLFRKMEDEEVTIQMEKLKEKSKKIMEQNQPTPDVSNEVEKVEKPIIQFDDFSKVDLKTGTIISAEKVAKADKLLKLEVDLGKEIRTIVSGIAMHFNPENIIGQKVVVVTNLAPRKMKGIESNGMILMAENADGKLEFISSNVNNGSSVS